MSLLKREKENKNTSLRWNSFKDPFASIKQYQRENWLLREGRELSETKEADTHLSTFS